MPSFRPLLPLFALVFGISPTLAETSPPRVPIERVELFAQHQAGFFSYRIPGIIVTARGTVLAYCEARRYRGSDWDDMEIHLRRSMDGGHTWTPAEPIGHEGPHLERNPSRFEVTDNLGGPDEQTVNNPVMIADRDGTVHFLYCVEYMRCFYRRSDDDGVTWTAPTDITAAFAEFRTTCDWQRIATGPGHGIQLRNGRLIVPIWAASHENPASTRALASVIYSDDHGVSWQTGAPAIISDRDMPGVSECIAAQIGDGRVMLNVRNHSPQQRRAVTFSADGVAGWSVPELVPDLLEPVCMAGLLAYTELQSDDSVLLFSNPDNLKSEDGRVASGVKRERRNLTLKLSRDNGLTWPQSLVVEPGPSAYSDLAALADGTILCFYESGKPGVERPGRSKRSWPYATLMLARIDPALLRNPGSGE